MISFDTKNYSRKFLQLISWSHWFTFFNIIAAIILSSYYLFSEGAPDTLLGQIYLVTTWVSHTAFLIFISFVLVLFPLILIWPNIKVIRGTASVVFTLGLLLLILDGFIYSRLGYHLNASSSTQIFSLISEIAQKSGAFYLISGILAVIIFTFEFIVSNYAWRHLKQLQKTVFARYVIFSLVLAFFFSHITHIWADANLDYDVLRQDTVLPLSYPATAKTLLTKYGLFDINDYIERKTSPLSFSQTIPTYPTLPLEQCSTDKPKRSVFVVLSDEQLNEQELSHFKHRVISNSLQLNHHIDTALASNGWFNLFYSLPNIYQQDILQQSIKPLLFQATDQLQLTNSFTVIGDDIPAIGNDITESEYELWFAEYFQEKNHLNDISTLVFADKLNSKKVGLHLIYFHSDKNKANTDENNNKRYQFELFIDALLLAQKQKTEKDIIWFSSLGNKNKDTRLSTKRALLILPENAKDYKQSDKANKIKSNDIQELDFLTSHMDLQPTLLKNWLNCNLTNINANTSAISNGVDLSRQTKDRIIATTSAEGIMVFNKDKSVFIDQNGNFESYSSQLAAPITVNKDFPLMIDGVHFIKRFSQEKAKQQPKIGK